MKDPKSAPAGSEKEPAASNPEPGMMPAPAGYQFPSRKARRHAELTGMIPIIVPAPKAPASLEVPSSAKPAPVAPEPAARKPEAASPVKHDAGPGHGAQPTDTSAGKGADTSRATSPVGDSAEAGEAVEPKKDTTKPAASAAVKGKAPKSAWRKARRKASMDTKVSADATVSAVATVSAGATVPVTVQAGGGGQAAEAKPGTDAVPAEAPRPVSAAAVTGIAVVPAANAPVALLPRAATEKAPRTPKAGRDLPAAITVGVSLLVLVIGTLLFYPLGFVAVTTLFACVGVWEVSRAIAGKGITAPLTPIMVGALAMPASAYLAGSEGLLFALAASAVAAVLWRSLDPAPGAIKSILAGLFSLMWIPFLLSFVFLMIRGEQGPTTGLTLDLSDVNPGVVRVMIMLLLVVANDTFGYLVGVLFGKHPMAPKISPKKSWEGFAGSLGGAMLVAIPATVFFLDQHWWVGFALAIGMVCAGTGGDFAESMVKRELGVKDMSNLLPGHGGVMDRLDSILFAAPVAYAIFTVLGRF